MAYVRSFSPLRIYGTSSRSTNFNVPKETTTDSLTSTLWKTASYVSSFFKPVASLAFSKTSQKPSKQDVSNISEHSSHSSFKKTDTTEISQCVVPCKERTTDSSSENVLIENPAMLEETFYEWIRQRSIPENKKALLPGSRKKSVKPLISKLSIEQRSRFLVKSLQCAMSSSSHLLRLEEICKHLLMYPQEKNVMFREGLLRHLLWLRKQSTDCSVQEQVRVAMSLLGFHDPPNANGIRILSIDGGGTRGIMAIEIMRQLERRTDKKIYQLFDYICGVSSGAILSFLLGGLRMSLDECEALYRKLSAEVFSQSPLWGTGRLVWNHAYYDTTMWVDVLKEVFGEKFLIDVTKDEHSPKLAAISAVMNLTTLRAFVFRNYAFPPMLQSQYLGSCSYKMWEAIRASGAAPGYFEEYRLDEYLHQDGGIMINNPASLAIHESHLLWPSETIQCVVSLGSGRYSPLLTTDYTSTSLKMKLLKIIDSATDTEGVHITLHDLLSSNTYFRFNPYLTEFVYLDENRPEKLQQLKTDAQMYLRRNEYKFAQAISRLSQPRSRIKKISDWVQLQKLMFW